ncbi:MAG: response regulator [Pseudobdellovibrionaceae bacterium]
MSQAPHILIIDDESDIRQFLRTALKNGGYVISEGATAAEGLTWIEHKMPDLVILDLGLPDMDGKDVLMSIRGWTKVPVIILSARGQEDEKVAALECGADDYLTKPFGIAELLARIKVSLRHASVIEGQAQSVYHFGDLEIDQERRTVTLAGKAIQLTPTEYKLLSALVRQPGKVLTQSALINAVWGKSAQGNNQYLRIYIQRLRTKLGDDPVHPKYIITDSGIGYRLACE